MLFRKSKAKAHNPEVAGSNPAPATKQKNGSTPGPFLVVAIFTLASFYSYIMVSFIHRTTRYSRALMEICK